MARGEFAATLRPVSVELDVVLIYDEAVLDSPDRWVMQLLASGPIELYPGRLRLTAISHNDGTRDIDQEAQRSTVRVQDQTTGKHLVTGWLAITEGGAG